MTHQDRIKQAQASVNKMAASMNGHFRQKYHFMAPAYWINDPNGCMYHNGQYHLYYQHHPYSAQWGCAHWGHAASRDLVHWEHLPIALAPSEPYDDHPQGGVFSGSTLRKGNTVYAFYTGTANHGQGFVQTQCMAESHDGGLTFSKSPNNPLISLPPAGFSSDFRDPRILEHDGRYYMVLGSSLGAGAWQGGDACALLYRSDDLIHWTYQGVFARSNGEYGTMWECLDLFELDGKWVMTFSPMFSGQRKAVYWVGEMDFTTPRFIKQTEGELDWGMEWYAPQTLRDALGNTFQFAWQNAWDWMPWWRDFGPTGPQENWCGCMALPRKLSLDAQHRIVSEPAPALRQLRSHPLTFSAPRLGNSKQEIPAFDPISFELKLTVDLTRTTAKTLRLALRADQSRQTLVVLDLANQLLTFDRTHSDEYSQGQKSCRLLLQGSACVLHLFSDVCSIELFTDNGLTCMSDLIYPTQPRQTIYLWADQGEACVKAETWKMEGIW